MRIFVCLLSLALATPAWGQSSFHARVFNQRRMQDTCGSVYSSLSTSLKIGVTGDSLIFRSFGVSSTNLGSGSAKFKWLQSSQGAQTCGGGDVACEYYLEKSLGGLPLIAPPLAILENDSPIDFGEIGSLSSGEWGWGDNDSLGGNTVYAYLSTGLDPDNANIKSVGDCISAGRVAAMAVGNQVENQSIDSAFLTEESSCLLTADIWKCNGGFSSVQYEGVMACEGIGDCNWIVTGGGYWDLVTDCSSCNSECTDTVIPGIRSDMEEYISQIQSDSGGAGEGNVVIIGVSSTVLAIDACLGYLNDEYENIASLDGKVWFVDPREDGITPSTHPDYFDPGQLHWSKKMKLYVGDRVAGIINAN